MLHFDRLTRVYPQFVRTTAVTADLDGGAL